MRRYIFGQNQAKTTFTSGGIRLWRSKVYSWGNRSKKWPYILASSSLIPAPKNMVIPWPLMFHAPFFRKIILSAHSLHRCNDSSIPRSFPRIVLPRIFTSSKPKLLTTSPKSSSPKPPRTLGFMLFFQGVNIHNTTTIVGGFNQPIWKTYILQQHWIMKPKTGIREMRSFSPLPRVGNRYRSTIQGELFLCIPEVKISGEYLPPKKKTVLGVQSYRNHTEVAMDV